VSSRATIQSAIAQMPREARRRPAAPRQIDRQHRVAVVREIARLQDPTQVASPPWMKTIAGSCGSKPCRR
jgi:hypothetical protein